MALEHRDWYREKKPDWNNISLPKKSRLWLYIVFAILIWSSVALQFYFRSSRPSVVSVPVQSPPAIQSVSVPVTVPVLPRYASLPLPVPYQPEKKESQLVSTAGGGYSGYIEYNGKRQSVYEPAVVSQTFKYRSVSNIKYLDVEINGVPFEVMLDTGASYVCLSSEALRILGINRFNQTIKMKNVIGMFDAHGFRLSSLKLGSFEVRDIEAFYIPSSSYNLLGGSFLKHFNYEINESAGTITFVAK